MLSMGVGEVGGENKAPLEPCQVPQPSGHHSSRVPAPQTSVKSFNSFGGFLLLLVFNFKAELRYMFRWHFLFQKGQGTTEECFFCLFVLFGG